MAVLIPNIDDRKLVQETMLQTGAVATSSSATIPLDDTIPQNTEGAQFMSHAHTPLDTANFLEIEVIFHFAHPAGARAACVALFKDSDASALASGVRNHPTATGDITSQVVIRHRMAAGTTSAITFKVRAGPNANGSTFTFNGLAGARRYGGTLTSGIRVTEFRP